MVDDDCFMMANWKECLKDGFYTVDPLSMHHFRITLEKWLSCALVYYVYTYFGLTGMRIILFAAVAASGFLFYKIASEKAHGFSRGMKASSTG